jgi:hypothetical protein
MILSPVVDARCEGLVFRSELYSNYISDTSANVIFECGQKKVKSNNLMFIFMHLGINAAVLRICKYRNR